ncbi:hypothetical protein [Nocardia flavorosea]|uniref:Uncharacterized protein n=1 Tax=Nocardia flavorosea TaxID=53429 RepID=A0A846YAY7_9NOCA|nr:hypothetical protein [Nocardia flavorosea]NKY54960.1 hypothetical protein [Nocardia flavorosea]
MNGDNYSTADSLPPLPQLWARWAAVAAASAAARMPQGPRVLPLVACFTSGCGSGSVLYARAPGTAELWGEVQAHCSAVTAGRPFGYRWKAGRWYHTEPAAGGKYGEALPDICTTDSTVDTICDLVGADDEERRAAAVTMVCAAELGTVARTVIDCIFSGSTYFNVDHAVTQLAMAGISVTGPDPLRLPPSIQADRAAGQDRTHRRRPALTPAPPPRPARTF